MPWTNYHSHSHYCDGKGKLEEYVVEAIRQGMPSYGFSTHGPVPFETAWNMKSEESSAYLAEISEVQKKYEGQIELYAGLEVDFIPEGQHGAVNERSPALFREKLDYTVGSIHFTGHLANGRPCEIDGPHAIFLEGLRETYQGDVKRFVSRYFECTRLMLREACPTVVGHLDKIKMQHENGSLFQEEEAWYRQEVHQMLEEIADSDAIVEVNTRGIYKKKTLETYPSSWILEEILKKGIPIMLNSDSHHPREISYEFRETAQQLQSIGFSELMALKNGQWMAFPFDEKGLMWDNL